MNRIKTVVLAAVAVTALMATVGAGSAAATPTVLCEEEDTTIGGLPICEPEDEYPAGTMIHAHLEAKTKLMIPTPFGVAECEESTLTATTEQQTAMPLGAIVNEFTFAKCGAYEVKTLVPGTLDIEIIDLPMWTHNGTLTFTNTKITVKKGEIDCEYTVGHSGVLTGGEMATIDLLGQLTRVGGNAKCPIGNAQWNGSYTVTEPAPLWIDM
jgi:hypothetical protein